MPDEFLKTVHVQYYAVLREQSKKASETIQTSAHTVSALYDDLKNRYPFNLSEESLKVAVNDKYVDWKTVLSSGDTVIFVPPVAGG